MTDLNFCAAIETLLEKEAAGRLDDGAADALRSHLGACLSCRTRAEASDPSLLFVELADEPVPGDLWAGFDRDLRARLEGEVGSRFRPAFLTWPRLAWAAPAVMLLVVGVMLFVAQPTRPRFGGWQRTGKAPLAQRVPGAAAPGRDDARAPLLEGVASPGARVYRFNVGDPGDETPIYFVVDESIDL